MSQRTINIELLQHEIAIQRSVDAYSDLFKYFHRPLVSFAASIVKSPEGAEEIYSDVMLKIWDMGASLANVHHLKVYLYSSIKNAALNYLARYQKVEMVDIESVQLPLQETHNPFQNLLQAEVERKIKLAIQALPPKCQLVYKLIREDGLSYREVAEILQLSIHTVEGHMTTALKKLGSALQIYLRPEAN